MLSVMFKIHDAYLIEEALENVEGKGCMPLGGETVKSIKYVDDVALVAKPEDELQLK